MDKDKTPDEKAGSNVYDIYGISRGRLWDILADVNCENELTRNIVNLIRDTPILLNELPKQVPAGCCSRRF